MHIICKFPSRGRPEIFRRTIHLFHRLASGKHKLTWICSFDSDDQSMNTSEIGEWLTEFRNNEGINIQWHYNSSGRGKVSAMNANLDNLPEDFAMIILVSDDMTPTLDWDDVIATDMEKWFPKLDGALDYDSGLPQRNIMPIAILGRNLFKRLGNRIYHPDYVSLFCDQEHFDLFHWWLCYKFINKIVIEHEHIAITQNDDLNRYNEMFYQTDEATYLKRKSLGFPEHSVHQITEPVTTPAKTNYHKICGCHRSHGNAGWGESK